MSNTLLLITVLATGVILFLALRFFLKAQGLAMQSQIQRFVESANERFISEQFKSKAVLEQNKQAIEHHVDNLSRELEHITKLIHDFENDRASKFATLDEKIAQSAHATLSLSTATQKLSSVIGNNQLRGQWGQRMAEDVLRAAGFQEGVNYFKEKTQESVSTRPDYTFPLPNGHKVHMDVKFPLAHYIEYTQREETDERERHLNEFMKDVRNRIRELKKREYINPEERTLDYVILFIPSEQIYVAIHQSAPELMDEALAQKVVLTSPYLLFGLLSVIRQACDNFNFNKSASEILKLIKQFLDDYENFKKRFSDLGDSIDRSKEKYDEISDKSFKRLDLRIRKLEEFRKGQEGSEAGTLHPGEEEFILQ